MKKILVTLLYMFFALATLAQNNEKRIALIVGNSDYKNASPLKNPVNDANLMASTLRSLGFEVILKTDADLKTMQLATAEFTNKIGNYDVSLFYYAGHGLQVDGENYLIPVDAKLDDKVMCQFEAFNINFINGAFKENQKKLNVMILDACRNNPFRSWARGGSRGFKAIGDQSAGTIIAFATREGETASDGSGKNGLFTEKLVQQISKSQNITEVFQNTRVEVLSASENTQCPQEWNMLTGNFYFSEPSGNVTNNNVTTNNNVSTDDNEVTNDEISITERKLPPGSIKLTSNMNGTLYIDGKSKGKIVSGKEYTLDNIPVGSHLLKIGEWEQTVEIVSNQTEQLSTQSIKQTATAFKLNADFTAGGIKMRGIKGGSFNMGDLSNRKDETPHTVSVRDFAIMKYEVTFDEYDAFCDATSRKKPVDKAWGRGKNPVIFVSWIDAVAYAAWLSNKTGQTWRLPTEAEWEYAARGGKSYKYAGSDNIEEVAWYIKNNVDIDKGPKLVGQKSPNGYGLYDMCGNVWEWCSDWYADDYYKKSLALDPPGPAKGGTVFCAVVVGTLTRRSAVWLLEATRPLLPVPTLLVSDWLWFLSP